MWTHCTFCTADLGRNEILEPFPFGRRLAFDPKRGRLWVLCRACSGWNLTPLEERWEAIEESERHFRETRARVSTGELGMARLSEGLELVRIGRPLRPEFAAWRYGDRFGMRRRRLLVEGGLTGAVGGGTGLAWFAAHGLFISGGFLGAAIGAPAVVAGSVLGVRGWLRRRPRTRLQLAEGRVVKVRGFDLERTALMVETSPESGAPALALSVQYPGGRELLNGAEAERAMRRIVRQFNRTGAPGPVVTQAVERIEREGHPEAFLREALRTYSAPAGTVEYLIVDGRGRELPVTDWNSLRAQVAVRGSLASIPAPERLALEMALHEEGERRAMEGELDLLTGAWEEAEAIAAIADNLLVPPEADDFIREHRR